MNINEKAAEQLRATMEGKEDNEDNIGRFGLAVLRTDPEKSDKPEHGGVLGLVCEGDSDDSEPKVAPLPDVIRSLGMSATKLHEKGIAKSVIPALYEAAQALKASGAMFELVAIQNAFEIDKDAGTLTPADHKTYMAKFNALTSEVLTAINLDEVNLNDEKLPENLTKEDAMAMLERHKAEGNPALDAALKAGGRPVIAKSGPYSLMMGDIITEGKESRPEILVTNRSAEDAADDDTMANTAEVIPLRILLENAIEMIQQISANKDLPDHVKVVMNRANLGTAQAAKEFIQTVHLFAEQDLPNEQRPN